MYVQLHQLVCALSASSHCLSHLNGGPWRTASLLALLTVVHSVLRAVLSASHSFSIEGCMNEPMMSVSGSQAAAYLCFGVLGLLKVHSAG